MTLRERVLQFPKTLYALVFFLIGNTVSDIKEQIKNANQFWKNNDFQRIVDFFKSKNIHVGLITSPSGIYIPWITGNNFFNIPLTHFTNEKDAWLAAFESAAAMIEGELPEIPTTQNYSPTSQNTYKTLTEQDVINAINEMGNQFTTLDLKKYLRNQGFFAEQKQVSDFMITIAPELDIDFTDNGQYRTYTKPEVVNDPPVVPDSKPTIDNGDPGFFRQPSVSNKKFDTNKIGDWSCNDAYSRHPFKNYPNTSWLQAKKQYARETGIKYFDVRIRKS